jgi:hypothetical protein
MWFCASDQTGPKPCHKSPDPPNPQFPTWMYSSPPGWKPESDSVQDRRPWRAPGTTVPASPCGHLQINPDVDGLSLNPTPRETWQAGSNVTVSHSLGANHGGGYSWRLCRDDGNLTKDTPPDVAENCFRQNPLRFADEMHTVRWRSGKEVPIPATQTDIGTVPAGSQWRRNPIPSTEFANSGVRAFQAPCDGCWGGVVDAQDGKSNSGNEGFSVLDTLIVPDGQPAGNYVLQWRWDTESLPHQQVWTNCADITVTPAENKALMLV